MRARTRKFEFWPAALHVGLRRPPSLMPFVDADGVSIHYALAGEGPDAVVLLHEMGGTLESWDEIAPSLSQSHKVLRYDQRGAGWSEKVRTSYDLELNVSDLEALLSVLNVEGRIHVVAIAASAAVALSFAERHPEVVASQVLCNPAVGVAAERVVQLEERADLIEREGLRSALEITLGKSLLAGR